MDNFLRPDETMDDVAGGRLKVLQKARGYRFSLDAVLLSWFVRLRPEDRVMELGAGSGVISLILAACRGASLVTGLDIQAEMVDMARRSVSVNGLEDKVAIRQGDVRQIKDLFPPSSWEVVVCNPPYRKAASGRINPIREKALARHEITGAVSDFTKGAGYLLRAGGRAFFIYPAARMVELISSFRSAGIEPKRLRLVHSHSGGEGKFVLLEGVREGREELQVMPPLFIYNEQRGYTGEMASIFNELAVPGACDGLSP